MRIILLAVIVAEIVWLSGCATSKVVVKNCKDAGDGLSLCEKVKDL